MVKLRIDSKKNTVVGRSHLRLFSKRLTSITFRLELKNKIKFCFCGRAICRIISKKLNFPFGSKLEISSLFFRRRNGCLES